VVLLQLNFQEEGRRKKEEGLSTLLNLKRYDTDFDRKQFGYKPPDLSVERERSSEFSSQAPGFISRIAIS
jgi:hypothetical protein